MSNETADRINLKIQPCHFLFLLLGGVRGYFTHCGVGVEWGEVSYARLGRGHLDIAKNSTVEISKIVQLQKIALQHDFLKLKEFGYFIVEFFAMSLGYGEGGSKITKNTNK